MSVNEFKERKACVALKHAACTVVSLSMFAGLPAAELIHEDKHGEQAVLPRGAHEHPVEENRPNHIQSIGISMSTTTSSSPIFSFSQEKWTITS